jgi:hypothetical protein
LDKSSTRNQILNQNPWHWSSPTRNFACFAVNACLSDLVISWRYMTAMSIAVEALVHGPAHASWIDCIQVYVLKKPSKQAYTVGADAYQRTVVRTLVAVIPRMLTFALVFFGLVLDRDLNDRR